MPEIDIFKIDDLNKESQRQFEKIDDRKDDDIKKILKLPEGRRLLLDLVAESGALRASFTLNSMTTAFNEGKRDMGLYIIKKIDKVEPMAFSQMMREYFSELKSKKQKGETNE